MFKQAGPARLRVLECQPGSEYDQETFHYFVSVEQARAQRSGAVVRLLLVSLEPVTGSPVPLPRGVARQVFAGLGAILRDTDIVGWYTQRVVIGAVLVAPHREAAEDISVFQRRVQLTLSRRLPPPLAAGLQVAIVPCQQILSSGARS